MHTSSRVHKTQSCASKQKRILSAVTPNQLDRSSLTAGGVRNTLFFQPAILIRLLTNLCDRTPQTLPPFLPPPLATPQKLRILAIRDTLVKLAGLPSPRFESDPYEQPSPLVRCISGEFHDTRSTWLIDSKVSSNPEIGMRRGREGRGSSRQDSGNRTKIQLPLR